MFLFKEHFRTSGQRVRTLTNWKIHHYESRPVLTGYVLKGNEAGDGQALRFTTTSEVVARIGTDTLVTYSGSRYTLETPHEDQSPEDILMFPEH